MAYDIDPSLTDVPIHVSELQQVLASDVKELLRDQRKFQHLMGRVLATLRSRGETIQQLNRDIAQMQQQAQQVGRATTLNPIDQVRYLSQEQIAQIFGKMEQERLAAMDNEARKSREVTKAAVAAVNKTRYALLTLIEDQAMPTVVRERVQQALALIENVGEGSLGGSRGTPGSQGGWQA